MSVRPARLTLTAAFLTLIVTAGPAVSQNGHSEGLNPLSVQITSPIGRMGMPSRVRIVAQVRAPAGATLQPIRFFVNGEAVGVDSDGPPYGVDWTDENPFERREISVDVADHLGNTARDVVVLKPFEITEATQITSVLVDAGVYDKKGRFVPGLDAASFEVREDGVVQALDLVRVEAIPANFALLIDGSQSMSRRMEFVKMAAARLLSYLRSVDRVMVVPFTKTLGTIVGPTSDRDTVTDAIGSIRAQGGTAIFDALRDTADRLAGMEGRRAIILVTDGYDEHSRASLEMVLEHVRKARVTVYVVAIGGVAGISLKGERILRDIAETTGGRAFFPPREDGLVEVYDTLAADAQHRYLLTYTPTNQRADGRWRAITVSTAAKDHLVRARDGYLAPRPAPIRPVFEFTVMDLESRYLNISRDELVVLEDGIEQSIETFQEAVTPLFMVLALDASGSMKKSSEAVKGAARGFVAALRPEDRLAVLTFADDIVVAHALGVTRAWSFEAIDRYAAQGGTALYDALFGSIHVVKEAEGRRAIVVLTDGRDENNPGTAPGSIRTHAEVFSLLREVDVAVFPVGLGTKIDPAVLKELARLSGGQAYFPSDVSRLGEEYAKIIENLSRRWVISYTSTNSTRDGAWREVEIRTRSSRARVTSRPGYYAPDR